MLSSVCRWGIYLERCLFTFERLKSGTCQYLSRSPLPKAWILKGACSLASEYLTFLKLFIPVLANRLFVCIFIFFLAWKELIRYCTSNRKLRKFHGTRPDIGGTAAAFLVMALMSRSRYFLFRIDWLIDWIMFYAVVALFQPYNGGSSFWLCINE